jgi:hypothetical protein
MQEKFVLTNSQESIARLSFFKRLGIEKGIGPRTNKLHDESMPPNHELCDCVEHLLRSSKAVPFRQVASPNVTALASLDISDVMLEKLGRA